MSPSVLIAGCGYVGSALALRLLERGWTVHGLRRNVDALPSGVEPVAADLTEPGSLEGLPQAVDTVVYAASAGGYDADGYRATYVEGPLNLLGALEDRGISPERFMLLSSTGVYGEKGGGWVDEDTPPEPGSARSAILLEGEEALRRRTPGAMALRLGGIYGPGRTRIIEKVRAGEAVCPPEPVYSNRIHRDDCAGVLEHLLTLPDPEPLYLGVDREPAPLCTVYRWLAREMGVAEPRRGAEGRRGRRTNKRCSSRRLVESGYEFLYPTFRDGYGALLEGGA